MAKEEKIDSKGTKELGDNISDASASTDELLKKIKELNDQLGKTGKAGGDLGKDLSSSMKTADVASSNFSKGLQKIKSIGKFVTDTVKTGFDFVGKSMAAVGGLVIGITKNLVGMVNPIKLAAVAVAAMEEGFQKGQEAASRISQQNVDIARTLGVAQSKANELAGEARAIGGAMGITSGQATAAAGEIMGAMSGIEKLSKGTLNSFMRLNVFAGISGDTLADIQKLSKLTGDDAGNVAENMAKTAQETLRGQKVNVSMKQVMNESAKVSSVLKLQLGGSGDAIVKAVIQSKKLGIELQKAEDIANGLLNIEDSINAEMEAELLTGKELNLEKAREAALNNDTATLMEEIASQVGTIEDFNSMNRLQQDAIAKSIGMSREELAKTLTTQQENMANNDEMLAQNEKGTKAMESQASLSEGLQAAEEGRAAAMSGIFSALMPLSQMFKDLATQATLLVKPLVDTLAPVLTQAAEKIMPVIMQAFDSLKPTIELIGNALRPIIEKLAAAAETIIPMIATILNTVGGILAQLMEPLGKIFDSLIKIAEAILPSINTIFKVIGDVILNLVTALQPVFDVLAKLAEKIMPLIASIFEAIKEPVNALVNAIAEVLPPLIEAIQPILEIIFNLFKDLAATVLPIITDLIKLIVPLITNILVAVKPLIEQFAEMAKKLLPTIMGIIQKLLPPIIKMAEQLLPPIIKQFTNIMKIIEPILNLLLKIAGPILEKVIGAVVKLFNVLKPVFDIIAAIGEIVAGIFTGDFTGIVRGFKSLIASIGNMIVGFVEGFINALPLPDISMDRYVVGADGTLKKVSKEEYEKTGVDQGQYLAEQQKAAEEARKKAEEEAKAKAEEEKAKKQAELDAKMARGTAGSMSASTSAPSTKTTDDEDEEEKEGGGTPMGEAAAEKDPTAHPMYMLLERIAIGVENGSNIYMDGNKVGGSVAQNASGFGSK